MTFVVNTVAELVRQRLRETLQGDLDDACPVGQVLAAAASPLIWLTGSALGICLLMIAGLIGVILVNGLGFFWPGPLERVTLKDGGVFWASSRTASRSRTPAIPTICRSTGIQLSVGNRDLFGFDFRWIDEAEIATREQPHGRATSSSAASTGRCSARPCPDQGGRTASWRSTPRRWRRRCAGLVAQGAARPARDLATSRRARSARSTTSSSGCGSERASWTSRRSRAGARPRGGTGRCSTRETQAQKSDYATKQSSSSSSCWRRAATTYVTVDDRRRPREGAAQRSTSSAPTPRTSSAWCGRAAALRRPALGVPRRRPARGEHRGRHLPGDLRHRDDGAPDEPRRGAVRRARRALPARVRQAGAAGPHRAHRGQQPGRRALDRLRRLRPRLLRLLRRAARSTSCSSPRRCRRPTFGTGGILWASLTLALLTVPVVIVATEEALAAVPRSMREGSLALGATKFQTILRVVLPARGSRAS